MSPPVDISVHMYQVKVGDETLSVLEIWGAEYQENDCILIPQEKRELLEEVCLRERTFMQVASLSVCPACLAWYLYTRQQSCNWFADGQLHACTLGAYGKPLSLPCKV